MMNGILVINKEQGFTSRDVINILNKKLDTKKIGHTGTLDPIATGVLVVCVGRYTKLVDKITSYDKEYVATIELGKRTDTLDSTGHILEESESVRVDNSVLINTLHSFLGKSKQEVPAYSAIKIDGKKLYEYARNNECIELPKREIEIKEIELLKNEKGFITFRTVVSKGTYIRSLIRDICKSLNVLGTMSSLERTRQGNFKISGAVTLEDIDKNNDQLLQLEDIFDCPFYEMNEEEYFKFVNGVKLEIEENSLYLLLKYQNQVVALSEKKEGYYKTVFRNI